MAAISDSDVSIDASGNIRWTGEATQPRHTVLEFIQWLMDKQDDAQAAGDDLLDITVDTPFDRSTDQIVTLNSPFNIDESFAQHLYDGSVAQTNQVFGGTDLWSGLSVIGPVETGTEYIIIQNGKVLPAFWGSGINPEASPSLVFSRHLVRSRVAGSDIDNQNILVLSRELGDQYRRFPVTLGTGNSVAAIGNGADIFNTGTDSELAAYFGTILNTEGFQELDIDGTGATGQEFYSRWDTGGQTINDVYEFTKWITQRSHTVDSNSELESPNDSFIIDNATIVGRGNSFTASAVGEVLTQIKTRIAIGGGAQADFTGNLYMQLYASDAGSPDSIPTGLALARSENILASQITGSFEEVIFRFNRFNPSNGVDQRSGLTLSPSTEYFFVIHHDEGTATEWFEVEGSATSTHDSNATREQPAGTFIGQVGQALWYEVATSPAIHGLPGEIFQGINVSVSYDNETGEGVHENDIVFWGTLIHYDTLAGGPFFAGEEVTIRNDADTSLKSGGTILYDNGVDQIVVALDTPGAAVIDDNDLIEGLVSGATAAINVAGGAIEDEDLSGGQGIILAKDDNGTTGEIYLQVLTGANPVDNNRIRASHIESPGDSLDSYVDATTPITSRTVNPEFVGTSTGSNIIGSYGIGFDPADVGSSDLFTDLNGATRQPPNNVVFTVSGLVSGEDRVLVGPRNGTALDRGMWLLATALTGGAETAVVVKTGTNTVPFPSTQINWPSAGDPATLRIELDTGIYRRIVYSSHDGVDTFTIPSTDFSGANAAAVDNDVFLAFIDVLADASSESFTGVHGGVDRDLFVRVRDGGATPIKTFESTSAQFLSTPVTIAAIRTPDF